MNEQEWMDTFGDNLSSLLDEANMTQRELADALGINEGTVSRWVNKERIPSVKSILNTSYVLNCDVGDLIDFGDKIR